LKLRKKAWLDKQRFLASLLPSPDPKITKRFIGYRREKRTMSKLYRARVLVCFLTVALFAANAHASGVTNIDPALCRNLVNATPDADVAYQPGVDVHGNAVAPADLPGGGGQIKMPKTLKIPLTVNLAQSLGLNTSAYPYNQLGAGTEASLGTLTVEGNKVMLDGQPLSDPQQDKLAVLCMQPR
jgi:hypothetical protein